VPPDDPRASDPEADDAAPGARSLAEDFRRGDPSAVDEVRCRVDRIIAFRGYRIPPDEREGLRQETLSQVWQAVNRGGLERLDRGFWGFVQTVAARRCIDWMRRQTPEPAGEIELEDPRRGPLALVLDRERDAVLGRALAHLEPACRELIDLRIRGEMSYSEISRRLGRSEQALRAQMYRCVGKARDFVLAEGDDDA
jgi:RNA polymerase sigma factor (sigma-70 family)